MSLKAHHFGSNEDFDNHMRSEFGLSTSTPVAFALDSFTYQNIKDGTYWMAISSIEPNTQETCITLIPVLALADLVRYAAAFMLENGDHGAMASIGASVIDAPSSGQKTH